MKDTYLGDGVYASFDGYHVWLDLRAQFSFPATPSGHQGIALDGETLNNLLDYVASLKTEIQSAMEQPPSKGDSC